MRIFRKTNTQENSRTAEKEEETQVLVLYNDDVHSFDFVIDTLQKVCNHSAEQAVQCAFLTHYTGKTDIMQAELTVLQTCKNTLTECGLSVSIEKMN
ncbi:MAG: ATP-dependent Clp protease adaptor ClpS [Bacteroidales bacterium]|nr:ATP-dependent Clp protease adaptor ClpS [Bacteroidales bacterium]